MAQIEAVYDDQIIVIWRNGELSGDPLYVNDVRVEAIDIDSFRLGPPEGPYSEGDHLSTALGFCLVANRILPEETTLRGDLPAERETTGSNGDPLL